MRPVDCLHHFFVVLVLVFFCGTQVVLIVELVQSIFPFLPSYVSFVFYIH